MKFRFAIAVAAIAAVTAGATYATTSLTSGAVATNTIQACVKDNGDVRIVQSPAQCKVSEHPVSWNVVGPKGDKGDKGDTGAPGPKGADGKDGKDGKDGTTFTSIDGLAGLSCRAASGPGTTQVSYANNDVIIACVASSGGGDTGGGTGVSCTPPADPPHGTANCDSNGNVVYACSYGWADADDDLTNGCEQALDLQNDPHNCGTPGNDVTSSFPHAIGGCRNGTAVIAACDPGYSDLNGHPSDGCEYLLPSCPHPNGLGGTYSDCNDTPGTPGDPATYTLTMALLAQNSWSGPSSNQIVSCPDGGSAVVGVNGTQFAVWQYAGSNAGHVHASAAPATCPTSDDPTWR